jgi:hypothetical protein
MRTSFSDRTDHAPAVRAHRHIHTTALPHRNQESATATSPHKHTAQQSAHTTPSQPHTRTDARSSASTSDVKLGADAREEEKEEVKSSSKVLGKGAPRRVGGSGGRQEEREGTSRGGGLMRLSTMDFFSADDVQGGHGDGVAALGPSHTHANDETGAVYYARDSGRSTETRTGGSRKRDSAREVGGCANAPRHAGAGASAVNPSSNPLGAFSALAPHTSYCAPSLLVSSFPPSSSFVVPPSGS